MKKLPAPLLTWSFIALAAFVLFSLNFLVVLPALDEIKKTASLSELQLMLRAKEILEHFFEQEVSSVKQAAAGSNFSEISKNMEEAKKRDRNLKYLFVESFAGEKIIESAGTNVDFKSILPRKTRLEEFYKRGYEISGPVSLPDKETGFVISVPLESSSAILRAVVDFENFSEGFIKIGLGGSEITYLLSENGEALFIDKAARLESGLLLKGTKLAGEILARREIRGEEFESEIFFPGKKVLITSAMLSGFPWAVVIEAPSSEILAGRERVLIFAIFLTLAAIILLVLLIINSRNLLNTSKVLEEEKDHVAFIVNTLADGIIEYDSDFRISLMNPRAEEITGVKLKEAKGVDLKSSDLKKLNNLLKLIMFGDNKQRQFILEGVHEKSYLELATLSSTHLGKKSYIKVIHDVSRDLFLARVKSEFISVAAHQLRTPLAALKWTIKVLLEEEIGKLDPKQKEYLEKAYVSNERMIGLVSDLLDASKIEEGRFGYEFEEADFSVLAEDALAYFRDIAKKRSINLEIKFPQEKLEKFVFDPRRIKIVLFNLLDNAINYTLPGGHVTLEYKKEGLFLKVGLTDSGIGIPENQQGRVFTKFFRADNVIRIQTEGSGLGLFIAKNIVRRHGGDLVFSSKTGFGTRFEFRIPLKKEFIPEGEKPLQNFLESM
ncbi:PAS domain-containing protein [Candidatus Giovannonibacteria bacterium]|nr:PAS domain-containing protein [Candidatus Giovannonibacteria bacterium]